MYNSGSLNRSFRTAAAALAAADFQKISFHFDKRSWPLQGKSCLLLYSRRRTEDAKNPTYNATPAFCTPDR